MDKTFYIPGFEAASNDSIFLILLLALLLVGILFPQEKEGAVFQDITMKQVFPKSERLH